MGLVLWRLFEVVVEVVEVVDVVGLRLGTSVAATVGASDGILDAE